MLFRTAFLVVALSSFAAAQRPLTDRLNERIPAALAASAAPSVSVAVVENGQLVYAKAFGKADIEKDRNADVNTRYAIGSVSKQFTVAALLLLAEEGKISLDDKVAKYFPKLTRATDISIRQLLSHTSGYEDYAPQDYIIPDWKKPMTPQRIMEKWAMKPLNFDPGTRYQYSNTGYVLAALIFEKASGGPLSSFLATRIFGPLGMTSASDCNQGVAADAIAYTRFALGPPRAVPREAPGWYHGAGQLCMTPTDLSKWNIAFMNKRILAPASYDEFLREVKLNDGKSTRYALGLSVAEGDNPSYSHSGEVSGFLAANRVYPTRRVAVTTLSNADNIGLTGALLTQIADIVLSPATPAAETERKQVEGILTGLRKGRLDRELFSPNASDYFSGTAIEDFRVSLEGLGAIRSLIKVNEGLRGGMKHLIYRVVFERKNVILNIYVQPDGKYDQFLVTEQ